MSDASQELGILVRDYSIYLGGIETMTVAFALLLLLTPPPAEKPPIRIPRGGALVLRIGS